MAELLDRDLVTSLRGHSAPPICQSCMLSSNSWVANLNSVPSVWARFTTKIDGNLASDDARRGLICSRWE